MRQQHLARAEEQRRAENKRKRAAERDDRTDSEKSEESEKVEELSSDREFIHDGSSSSPEPLYQPQDRIEAVRILVARRLARVPDAPAKTSDTGGTAYEAT